MTPSPLEIETSYLRHLRDEIQQDLKHCHEKLKDVSLPELSQANLSGAIIYLESYLNKLNEVLDESIKTWYYC